MKKKSTKERILDEALTLFSFKGFDAVSVGHIGDSVGIKAPSLYMIIILASSEEC